MNAHDQTIASLGLAFTPTEAAWRVDLSEQETLFLILQGVSASGSGTAGPKTPHPVSLGASATQVIPIGAKGWTITVITGTATINGASVPAGFSDSDDGPLAAAITVITAAASSAYVRWNT